MDKIINLLDDEHPSNGQNSKPSTPNNIENTNQPPFNTWQTSNRNDTMTPQRHEQGRMGNQNSREQSFRQEGRDNRNPSNFNRQPNNGQSRANGARNGFNPGSQSSHPRENMSQATNRGHDNHNSNRAIPSRGRGGGIPNRYHFRQTTSGNQALDNHIGQFRAQIDRLQNVIEIKNEENSNQREEIDRLTKLNQANAGPGKQGMDIMREKDRQIADIKAQVIALKGEKDRAEEKIQDIIRKQQEESFKRVKVGAWVPRDETDIKNDLAMLKRLMKNTTKDYAAASMPDFSAMGKEDAAAIVECLQNITRWEDGTFLLGMNKAKQTAVVLNALLAHHVYTCIIDSAFFFSEDINDGSNALSDTYDAALQANLKDAELWRVQTMRLLYPQLTTDTTEAEVQLHSATDNKIVEAANYHADGFMNSAVSKFLNANKFDEAQKKVKDIFLQAARLSYDLWTRKTALRCYTMKELRPTFDFESSLIAPHALVRYNEHEDMLKGRPIRMVVHPLVMAFGTDEGEDYEKSRVWMAAEVWLPSRDFAENI